MSPFDPFRGGSPKGDNVPFFYRFFKMRASLRWHQTFSNVPCVPKIFQWKGDWQCTNTHIQEIGRAAHFVQWTIQTKHLWRNIKMQSIEKLLSCVKFAISNFLQWGSLKSHQKTHREERAFICELCNAQFNFSNSLKVHTNKNHGGSAGSNIHTCSICTKEFHSPGGLQRHEKAIQQGVRYPCSICPH